MCIIEYLLFLSWSWALSIL
uniref:Uncharacterized protein n=1 Tax=Arundo donax TaxID=35708 RepID=A0A0A9HLB8_ARUDO